MSLGCYTENEGMSLPKRWSKFKNTHSIHGTGIFTYICHKNQPHVGKYTIRPIDPMGEEMRNIFSN